MTAVDGDRLKLWQVLSEFFLDTEVNDTTFDLVARTIQESSYTPEQAHSILWNELFPILQHNLRSMVGEWAGWSDEWLLENITVRDFVAVKPIRGPVGKEITRCWQEVKSRISRP
ncbi:DUF7079 family protein [Pseudomonas bohemica]|uniref:DUF7079 family protein n=1 Tax=Pseudomonas bohemica TaxID=2044872 RepID=UPI000DA61D65|nr:hypothetical protein [Pseudomonas bohemica]